jgi:hypothetical protein
MALNDVHRFSCVGTHLGTEVAIITLHARETSGIAEVAALANIIRTDLITPLAAQQSTAFRWDSIQVITDNTTPRRSYEYTTGFPVAGGNAGGDELPHQVAMVVTLKTAYAGRSYRGRVYLPALTEAQFTAGLFTAACVTAVNSCFTTLLGHIGSSGTDTDWRLVVWSEKLQTANNVTQVVVRNNPGVIRKRRIGVGQ